MRLSEQIAPSFHNVFHSKKVHQIYEGGRGGTKSSFTVRKASLNLYEEDDCNIVVIKKHKNSLRDSVYAEIKNALNSFGLEEDSDYVCTVSPLQITILHNGNTCYFGGMDDYEKLKGMVATNKKSLENNPEDLFAFFFTESEYRKIEHKMPQIKIVLMSEITEFREEEEILQTVATFSRGKKKWFYIMYEFNPPKNKYHWVNVWCNDMRTRSDTLVHHSDYRTVPCDWLGEIFIQQAEELKKNDEDRYNHIYLGLVTGLDGLIYNYDLINIIDKLDDKERVIEFDIFADNGHQISATPYLAVGRTNRGKLVLLDTYYYSPNGKTVKKAPSEFSRDLNEFINFIHTEYKINCDKIIGDSAEGAVRNQYYLDYGRRITPVAKTTNENMWDNVQELIATGKFHVLNNDNNQIFLTEHKNYEYKEGTIESGKPEADKKEKKLKVKYYNTHSKSYSYFYAEHSCDAFKYGVIMSLRKYGLKQ